MREGVKATEVVFSGERPVAVRWASTGDRSTTGEIRFDFLVDASGRGGVMATKYLHNREYLEAFRNIALWSYWRDVTPLDCGPQGAIAVCSVPYGWSGGSRCTTGRTRSGWSPSAASSSRSASGSAASKRSTRTRWARRPGSPP